MSLAEQLASKIKVKVTKPEPDDRISLAGEVFSLDGEGKWSCLIPASGKSYFKQLFPHYEFGEEFLPEEKKVEPEKK